MILRRLTETLTVETRGVRWGVSCSGWQVNCLTSSVALIVAMMLLSTTVGTRMLKVKLGERPAGDLSRT